MNITTQARRIARFSNEHGEPGWVGLYDADGRLVTWLGPMGYRLTAMGALLGHRLYRTSHGKDFQTDVQREIDEQTAQHADTLAAASR